MQQRFNQTEAEEILSRAIQLQTITEQEESQDVGSSFQDLEAIASECGIRPDLLREAVYQYEIETARRQFVRRRVTTFVAHLAIYAVVVYVLQRFFGWPGPILLVITAWTLLILYHGFRTAFQMERDFLIAYTRMTQSSGNKQWRCGHCNKLNDGVINRGACGHCLRRRD